MEELIANRCLVTIDNKLIKRIKQISDNYINYNDNGDTVIKNCNVCNNNVFEKDSKTFQNTCIYCGTVIDERCGSGYTYSETFQPFDHNFSSKYNLRTSTPDKYLNRVQNRIEYIVNDDENNRTRDGYKDNMKRKMIQQISDIGDSIQLHKSIIIKAQSYFSKYRDHFINLNEKNKVAAMCLILAYRELNKDKRIVFKCKKCSRTFSLLRDKNEHTKSCSRKNTKK